METHKKVMLIDDDNIINILNERMLQVTKFADEIIIFTQANAALELIKKSCYTEGVTPLPEFIFLDINMPGMDGWEFLDELLLLPHDALKNCKIIMLTSSIDLNDIEKSVSYSLVSNFISKPLTPDKLKSLTGSEQRKFLFEGND